MADIKTFHLPDLGEGLPDATIVEWHVKEGDTIKLDDSLASMETAKAVVEVPSPYTGKVVKFHGKPGDVIDTGAALADFEPDPNAKQRAEASGHGHAPKKKKKSVTPETAPAPAPAPAADAGREDEGTVVGAMASSNQEHVERASTAGGVKAVPAVRAMARKLKIDLTRVTPTGEDGIITMKDVKQAAADGTAARGSAPASVATPATPAAAARSTVSQAGKPVRTRPPQAAAEATGQPEQLKGVRRNMARVMADAHTRVVNTTIVDDADLNAWIGKQDITARLIRAIVTACKTVPVLNAWFNDEDLTITKHPHVDVGIAVDTDDGLFVPALRNADMLDAQGVRAGINRLRQQTMDRSIPSSELSGYTISLSNFGMFAGRYASPIVVPPCVAIVGAGGLSHDVVAVMGGVEVHRRLPISLSFDHRAATGGDAARFLKALLDDLALPQ